MFESIENIRIDEIHRGSSKTRSTVVNRKFNSFILRLTGAVRYTFPECAIELHPGEMVFLPQGSSYEFLSLTGSPCEYVAIRFYADIVGNNPFSLPFTGFPEIDEFSLQLPELWKFGGKAEHYKCYSIFYNLLSYFEFLEKQSYMNTSKSQIISPAISYLKEHIYDCNLSSANLHRLCGISGTYFRKIFQANYSVSPQKYIMSKRLSHAKTIIDSGDYNSITEVASAVGYEDPLYFSRAFKKKYGVSPTIYAKG